ncbi:efflux RND transporter periplasmic adaptor subunit [Brucella ceti]|nr:efflux RND transporter periplasmic adaptor subunit [Brucella ceti]
MKIHMNLMFRAAGCAVLFGALTVLAACGKEDEKAQEAAPIRPVLYTIVEPKPVAQTGFAGTVEPRYSTDLAFRVLGRVIARPVKVGDLVKKGEMVAMLDPSALDLAVQSARADLASAEAQYANASASEERQRILLRGNNVSQADYDAARQARDSAEAGLEKAQAGLRKTEDQRGYAVLRPDVREAVVDIPDSMTEYFKPGTPFNVQLQADPSVKGTGSVREVAPQADAQTRTRRVRIALDNPPEGFRLGATIQAARSTPETGFVSLPMPSLLEQDGKTSIWVIDPGTQTVSLHDVRVIERKGASFVAGGVEAGSYVAIAGVHELKAGQKVRLDEKGSGL